MTTLRRVMLYDVSAKKIVREFPDKSEASVAFSADGKRLAVGTIGLGEFHDTGTIRLYETANGKELPGFTGKQGYIGALALSPDARIVATVDDEGVLHVWECASGDEIRRFTGCASVRFSPDGRLLAAGGKEGEIRLYDRFTGKELYRLTGHKGKVTSLDFSADGLILASGSKDATALIWDVSGIHRPAKASRAKLDDLWESLLGDAREATPVIAAMLAHEKAASFLRDRVRLKAPDAKQMRRWTADLDSDDPETRDVASHQLRSFGKAAEPFLEEALADPPSAEVRRRAERLMQRLAQPTPSPLTLRNLRAIEILEHAATADARKALERISRLPSDSREAREAKEALARLDRKR